MIEVCPGVEDNVKKSDEPEERVARMKRKCCYSSRWCCSLSKLLLFDVTTLKIVRKPVKLQKENPAGCAGEGKQEKRKGRFK